MLDMLLLFIGIIFVGMMAIDLMPYLRKIPEEGYRKEYAPRTLVIVPCRGKDLTLPQNLRSIAGQSYANFKVVGVVDEMDDPASDYIKRSGIELLVSNYRGGKESGKVHAIVTALSRFKGFEVCVIADSDILVGRTWLKSLVAPLSNKKVGISTTFPRFVPRAGFWSKVKFAWGFVGEGMMENGSTRFGWGGSLAFRASMIDKEGMKMLRNSRYSVSDDIALTKIAKSRSLGIAYVSDSQPIVNSDDTFMKFAEWSNRQAALSVLGYRRNLYYGVAFYSAEILLMVSGVLLSYFVSAIFLLLFLHLIKSEAKTYVRAGVKDPTLALIVVLMPFIYLTNLLAASRATYITWRGRKYKLRQ